MFFALKPSNSKKGSLRFSSDSLLNCGQKAILPPEGGRIALSAKERTAEYLDFAIQAKFACVNKPKRNLRFFLRLLFKLWTKSYSPPERGEE